MPFYLHLGIFMVHDVAGRKEGINKADMFHVQFECMLLSL